MRPLALAMLAGLVLAGCGGSEREGASGVAGAETVRLAARAPAAWATEAELAWLRKVAGWSAELAQAGRRVAQFETDEDAFDRALAGDRGALARYAALLAPIRACSQTFARRVGTAPSGRLREAERTFADSCRHFRRGVDLLLQALRSQDHQLTEEARESIVEAGKQASVASGTLPPGEKQPLPVLAGPSALSRIDPRFSEAASAVADKPVEARCWSSRDWERLMAEEKVYTRGKVNEHVLGFASAGGRRISLAPSVCADLDRLAYGRERPRREGARYRLGLALVTLAHESVHASGVADEPTAECHGIQLAREAARLLGVGADAAAALVAAYWRSYPKLPRLYRSPECRDGGELDLDEGEDAFP